MKTTDGKDSEGTLADEGTRQRILPDSDTKKRAKESFFFFFAPPIQERQKDNIVINLSSRPLTSIERKVLNFGLSFVPTPGYNSFRSRIDLFKLT